MRADFQQYYNLNIDDVGVEYTIFHASALAAMLPAESRTVKAICPSLEWDLKDHLIVCAVNLLSILAWQNTEDGMKGINPPELIYPPGVEKPKGEGFAMPIDELEEFLTRQPKRGD